MNEEIKNVIEVGKVKHYQEIIDDYGRTEDEKLLPKVKYGTGYIAGVSGKRISPLGDNNYYDYGFEAGTRDREWHEKKKKNDCKKEIFDYGKIVISHRLNIHKPICHDKILIDKGILMGTVKKRENRKDAIPYTEVQIIHKVGNKSELFKGSLDDYSLSIKHKGDMQIDI
ncbi:MAG: hypothetical protein FWE22_05655 [Firmicutes bacterium]|nr:hypothetical protein [Bacillota bacterium]